MTDVLQIIHGDALSSLGQLPDESVQCVVTSPPYWGLRDYGVEPIVWDNHNGCEHVWGASVPGSNRGGSGTPTDKNNRGEGYGRAAERGGFCECGAWRGCFGLEPTPDLYVAHLVNIFREVRRVLRNDGVVWLNLGDSYAGGGNNRGNNSPLFDKQSSNRGATGQCAEHAKNMRTIEGVKTKDLVGIPWMVAFALRADGWYLRSDVVWSKPNPMPESVRDRPTRSHEYIFLLSKSERYYYNADAIAEPGQNIERPNFDGKHGLLPKGSYQGVDRCGNRKRDDTPRNDGDRWNENNGRGFKPRGHERPHQGFNEDWDLRTRDEQCAVMRNKRSVWPIATAPFPDAHFATFPTEIPRLCILAGSKAGDTILDPFAGSGTTAKVAIELGRKAIAIEPKAEYVEMIKRRCQTTIGLPLSFEAAS